MLHVVHQLVQQPLLEHGIIEGVLSCLPVVAQVTVEDVDRPDRIALPRIEPEQVPVDAAGGHEIGHRAVGLARERRPVELDHGGARNVRHVVVTVAREPPEQRIDQRFHRPHSRVAATGERLAGCGGACPDRTPRDPGRFSDRARARARGGR